MLDAFRYLLNTSYYMLALCLMLLGTCYTLPIMLALCLMLLGTYYAQNYAGIIGPSLRKSHIMSAKVKKNLITYN